MWLPIGEILAATGLGRQRKIAAEHRVWATVSPDRLGSNSSGVDGSDADQNSRAGTKRRTTGVQTMTGFEKPTFHESESQKTNGGPARKVAEAVGAGGAIRPSPAAEYTGPTGNRFSSLFARDLKIYGFNFMNSRRL